MVQSTLIVRASDALPLAASVDDEQVRLQVARAPNRTLTIPIPDGAVSCGAQTTSEAHLQTHHTQL